MNLHEILGLLQGVHRNGKNWMALCPAHDDSNPSLAVSERKGKILLHCHAGCSKEKIVAAIGIRIQDLFHENNREMRIVATYDYHNEKAELLFQVVRLEPKGFRQRRPDGKGGWLSNLNGVRQVLYHLPELMEAKAAFICEGEKDCDTAVRIGFVATCNPGGAGKWRAEFSECLRGKELVIVADADKPGRKHAKDVATSVFGKAQSVKVVELPGAKDLSEWTERGGTREALLNLIEGTPEWKPEIVGGAELLMAAYRFVRRFISMSESQAAVIALWAAHTHAIDSADVTPYLAVTSAEKQSGKTRLLETLALIVANPWFTGRVTAAVLVRKVDDKKPTLLLDESDAAFGGEKEYAEALRGILNNGHRRGGVASLCVGKGAEMSYRDFSTFCPKAIAGIGKLPDTVADRSIPIHLKRAARGEIVERFRIRTVMPEANVLREKLEQWAESVVQHLREARPDLPDELSDRQQDGVEPLLAIADLAGKDWSVIARAAVLELCTEAWRSDDSVGVRLLADIRQVFQTQGVDKIASADLVDFLAAIETSPWGEWSRGKPLSAPKLARLLRPFEVASRKIRIGDKTPWGYDLADFQDAFSRYLPSQKRNNGTTRTDTGENGDSQCGTQNTCSGAENAKNTSKSAPCSGVPVSDAATGIEEDL
jgi:hypothetical protein